MTGAVPPTALVQFGTRPAVCVVVSVFCAEAFSLVRRRQRVTFNDKTARCDESSDVSKTEFLDQDQNNKTTGSKQRHLADVIK